MKAVVLAGGRGTRLREQVPELPKPMAPVAGRPFLEYILDRLVAGGLHEIRLALGYRAGAITSHFGDAYRGAALRYSIEPEPLGTGGAIALALNGESDAEVLVVNGDTLLDIDYAELMRWYAAAPAPFAMALTWVPDARRYGSLILAGDRVTGFLEKGRSGAGWVNAGVYILQPGVFSAYRLAGRFSLEEDLLQRHCQALSPRAYLADAYFVDIGVPAEYERAQADLRARQGGT